MTDTLTPVFIALRAVLWPYAQRLDIKVHSPTRLYVDTHHPQANGKRGV